MVKKQKEQDTRVKAQGDHKSLFPLFLFPRSFSSGFTLVEMIVSLGIFAIVATVSLGALVHIVSANKKAQNLQSAVTNLNFALETMSREMRVGSTYFCNTFADDIDPPFFRREGCALGPHAQIAFRSSKQLPDGAGGTCNAITAYRFVDASENPFTIRKAEQSSCNQILGNGDFSPLISTEDVTLTDIQLSVSPNDVEYPLLFIKISGYTGVRERDKSYFDVQTAISPRLLQN